jgi:hypothetical protein
MRADTKNRLIASFPVAGTARVCVRRVRLGVLGFPLFLYTLEQIRTLPGKSGWNPRRIERVGQIYRVAAGAV